MKDEYKLLDFWAPWCNPCKLMDPVLNEVQKEYNIFIEKINVDENADIAKQYNVSSVPTYILIKDGKEVKTLVGAKAKMGFVKALGLDTI